jgi:hypothetical protein
MPIPPLIASPYLPYTVLPVGTHDATLEEIEERYSYWGRTGIRMRLFESLQTYIRDLRFWNFAQEMLINGSYVCGKEEPGDIDVLLVYRPEFDFAAEGQPQQENLQDNRYTKRTFGINLWPAPPHSTAYGQKLEDLTTIHTEDKVKTDQRKGILSFRL